MAASGVKKLAGDVGRRLPAKQELHLIDITSVMNEEKSNLF